ncbi:MAG: hypothetical protein HY648_04280 [Acidobacteria bacterium]|nr:hypothetical protein [Acidobacteriota bacterium]
MGEKEMTISFTELSRMEVYCPACGAGVILDWGQQHIFPDHCCVCNRQFSESARSAMAFFQRFFQKAKESAMKFEFRVKAT